MNEKESLQELEQTEKQPQEEEYQPPKWRQRQAEYYTIGLRCAAGAYILIMGWRALKKAISGEESVPMAAAIGISILFIAAAAGILWNAWTAYKRMKAKQAAEAAEAEEKAKAEAESLKVPEDEQLPSWEDSGEDNTENEADADEDQEDPSLN